MKNGVAETPVHLRWLIRRDMADVMLIETRCFPAEIAWSEDTFIECLRQRNCIGMVAEHGERIVGFMLYELHRTKLQILNFAVHPDFQRQDVGRQMVEKLVSKLSPHRRVKIEFHVRERNVAAQLFFRRVGFRAVEVLRDYYDELAQPEDAYLMRYLQGTEFTGLNTADATDAEGVR
jgi:ribosomal-protein-alanine N-acetyltransferase